MYDGIDITIFDIYFDTGVFFLYGLLVYALLPDNQANEALRDLKFKLFRLKLCFFLLYLHRDGTKL